MSEPEPDPHKPSESDVLRDIRASKTYDFSGEDSTTSKSQEERDSDANRDLKKAVCFWLLIQLSVGVLFLMSLIGAMGFKLWGFQIEWQVVTSFSAVVITQSWTTLRLIVAHLFPTKAPPKAARKPKPGKPE